MELRAFQEQVRRTYGTRDAARGAAGTFMYFAAEVGELAEALRHGTQPEKEGEFADVLAWLVTLASLSGVDMETALLKYQEGCPACRRSPCVCQGVKP